MYQGWRETFARFLVGFDFLALHKAPKGAFFICLDIYEKATLR